MCKVTVKIPATIKKPHDFGSIQRVSKRLLHGTYRWGNPGSFLGIILDDSPVRTQISLSFQRKKKKTPNPEINVPDIREMFRRQAEKGQWNERKDSNKVIVIDWQLCYRKKISKRYTLSFLFNSSSSASFYQLGDYYLNGNNFRGN